MNVRRGVSRVAATGAAVLMMTLLLTGTALAQDAPGSSLPTEQPNGGVLPSGPGETGTTTPDTEGVAPNGGTSEDDVQVLANTGISPGSSAQVADTGASSGQLASTGLETVGLAVLAALLVGGGATLLWVGRRRTSA